MQTNTNDQNHEAFKFARAGETQQIANILSEGFDLQSKNENGHSLLMLAAYNGHYDLTKYLIEKGADIDSVDASGNSIVMGVVFKGHASVFDLFAQAGANLSYVNPKGQSAMDLAVMFGRRDFIFKINQALKLNRSGGRIEQAKAWINYVKSPTRK